MNTVLEMINLYTCITKYIKPHLDVFCGNPSVISVVSRIPQTHWVRILPVLPPFVVCSEKIKRAATSKIVCLFALRFNSPVNPMGSF